MTIVPHFMSANTPTHRRAPGAGGLTHFVHVRMREDSGTNFLQRLQRNASGVVPDALRANGTLPIKQLTLRSLPREDQQNEYTFARAANCKTRPGTPNPPLTGGSCSLYELLHRNVLREESECRLPGRQSRPQTFPSTCDSCSADSNTKKKLSVQTKKQTFRIFSFAHAPQEEQHLSTTNINQIC